MEKPREKEKTIAYRLGSPYTDRLAEIGASHGLSYHQAARLLAIMGMEQTAVHRCADEVADLKKMVARLEKKLN